VSTTQTDDKSSDSNVYKLTFRKQVFRSSLAEAHALRVFYFTNSKKLKVTHFKNVRP